MKPLPIRLRISLWYFSMFAAAALILSMTSWWMLHRSVDATEYHEMQERADDIRVLLNHDTPNITLAELRQQFTSTYSLKDSGKWLQVRDQNGNWIYRSDRMIEENLDLPLPDRLPAKGIVTDFMQGGHRVRALAYPETAAGMRYSIQTGVSLDKSIALLGRFAMDLFLLVPATILLAGLGGYFMSRRVLQPVAALAQEAQRINDRNLDTRLHVPAARDEISDLANTLNQMLERVDKAFASTRSFTGNASHELRTPIALLRTEIEVALYRPREAEEYRETLRRLLGETVRMTSLVEQLLSLARADACAEAIGMLPVSVPEIFARMMRTWRDVMERAVLDFRVEAPRDGLFLLGDQAGIERLLAILLDNAMKYTPAGGVVTLWATDVGSRVVLSVRDTGVGISEEDKPRIFDRFYRAAHANGSVPRGSGLGLALAKWIAERHGTQLVVESEMGGGSCFSVSFEISTSTPADLHVVTGEQIHSR